ncbi:MAG: SCO family protein [Hyphomonadaceae bacterium]|nr:SCO family protein [Hyphomonadaceae bacterium]
MQDTVQEPRRTLTGAIIPALGLAGLVAAAALLLVGRGGPEKQAALAPPGNCILENADGVGGPIDLVDGNGARVTEADFAGTPAALYFGFTHCPDVCPATMYTLAEALAQPGGYDVQTILVSVDPARDTPEVMRAYVQTSGFPAGLVGLTGSDTQIDAAKRAFQVYAASAPARTGDAANVYNVDHSSLLYIVDGNWRTVAIIPTMQRADPADPRSPMVATGPTAISACIAAGLERSTR